MKPHILSFFSFLLLFSCQPQEDNYLPVQGHEYMQLEVGKTIEYQVDSMIYDPTGDSAVMKSRWFLRDVIIDTLRDNTDGLLYRTERFFRKDSTQQWQVQKVYTQSIQANQGIVTEDNLRFIKLVHPTGHLEI